MWSRFGLPKPDRHILDRRYAQTLEAIYAYSSVQRGAAEIRLDRLRKPERLRALLRELQDPHQNFPCLLVAGTKGKGSTAAMIANILRAAGLRVGRYTQPHLVSWRERTWVNGRYLEVDETSRLFPGVAAAATRLEERHPELGHPTTFEIGTALTLQSFANAGVDAAVVEVGVGGRYDATNALEPILSVITPISFDHADVIGPTIAEIAYEKSGVMRADRSVIIAHQPAEAAEVIGAEAVRIGARAEWVGRKWSWREFQGEGSGGSLRMEIRGEGRTVTDLKLPLLGNFQRENATVATAAVLRSGLVADERIASAVREGLATLVWPGRVHVVSQRPRVIFDGAHNAESARQLVEAIRTSFSDGLIHWVVGMSRGKDVVGFLDAIRDSAHSFTATTASHVRSMPPEELAGLARTAFSARSESVTVEAESDPVRALSRSLQQAAEDDIVCATGSFFLLGDLYSEYVGRRGG
jgi:dihydrofolate synthase / folylpolyglutamate synthase